MNGKDQQGKRHDSDESVSSSALFSNEKTNSYLALRQAKIERNQARLQELGLIKLSKQDVHVSKKVVEIRMMKPKQEPSRRSRRLLQQNREKQEGQQEEETDRFVPLSLPDSFRDETEWSFRDAKRQRQDLESNKKKVNVLSSSKSWKPNSVRGIALDVEKLLLGVTSQCTSSSCQGVLGIPL